MKKHTLLAGTILIATFSFAQTKTTFGIKAGASIAGMKGDAVKSLGTILDYTNGMIATKNRTGLFAGGYASIPVGEAVSIEPGLYYAQKGMELRGDLAIKGAEFLGANAAAKLISHYIDLPVLVKVNMGGFQVFAGPQVSYLVKSNLKTTAGLLGFNLLKKTLDASSQFNQWDAGVTGGVGYQFKNGLNVSAAYDHGLMRTDKNQKMNAYNRSFKVGLGFSF